MDALAVIGTTIVGGRYGEAHDSGDFPMGVLLGFPGAWLGVSRGASLVAVVFA